MDRTIANRLRDEAADVLGRQQLREKHYDVFAVYLSANQDGSQLEAATPPRVVLIQPRPSVADKDVISLGEDGEQARLQRFEMSGISRRYSDADLRPNFWLILDPGSLVTPSNALEVRPRYRNLGTPAAKQDESVVVVVEER